jgi:hypothetical protein
VVQGFPAKVLARLGPEGFAAQDVPSQTVGGAQLLRLGKVGRLGSLERLAQLRLDSSAHRGAAAAQHMSSSLRSRSIDNAFGRFSDNALRRS